MSTFDWPTTSAFQVQSVQEPYLEPNIRSFQSQYSGAFQAVDLVGERYHMIVILALCPRALAGQRAALFNRLLGQHWLRVWNLARPQPAGTLRGNPTLASAAAQGAMTLILNSSAGATLLAGDMLGVGGLLMQCAADTTADGSGLMTVSTTAPLRTAQGASTGVVWYHPTTTWRMASPQIPISHSVGIADSVQFELIETW